MPAIFHVKIEDDTFDGAVNHIVEASDDDTVWHCEEAGDGFDGAIFHVKWAEDGHEEPVWRVSGISRGTVTTVGPAPSPLLLPDAIADSLSYVKAFGGTEQGNLPDGYTQLEYIESSGTQYIDIDVSGDATFIGAAQSTTDSPTTSQVLVSNSGAGAGHWFGVQSPGAGSSFAKRWGLGATTTASSTIDGTTKVDFEITFTQSSQYGTVNDQVLNRESSTSAHTDWIVFAGNTTPTYGFIGKVWGLKVVQNDVLVRNLIPAKNSSGVVGMYDLVSGQFFTNQGTGDFVAGPTAVPTPDTPMDIVSNNGVLKARHQSGLPLGYTQLTYIQSDGRQVINTGYVLQETDSVEVDYNLTDLTRTDDKFILGAQPVSDTSIGGFWVETFNASNVWYVRYGSGTSANTYGIVTPTSQLSGTLAVSKNSFVVNGIKILTPDFVSMPVNPMTIFNRISSNGSIPNKGASAQISEVRIKNGNNLVHRYIAVRNSNNELGMYDTVSGQFFTNSGTGTFTAGDPINDLEIYYDGDVETVTVKPNERENHFVQYIDAYLRTSTRSITAYSGNSVVTFDCEVGKTYCCINRAMSGNSTMINIGYSDTIPTIGYVYSESDFEPTSIVDGNYKTTGLVFTAKKRYATFIFRYDNDSSQNPTSMLEQMIFYEVAKAQSATCQPLLRVGDYKDVHNITSGAITRNVGIKVLDGTEGWSSYQSGACWAASSLLKDKVSGNYRSFSTHYGWASSDVSNMQNNQFLLHGTQRVCIKDDRFETATGFRQFLADQYAAGTPVIVVYPLATPTTESVTGQTLQVQAGDNTLEITQASLTGLELEAKYMKGVVASVQEVEPQGLDNNVSVSLS